MFKEKIVKWFIYFVVTGIFTNSDWAMGRKPAQKLTKVEKPQIEVQLEVKARAKESLKVAETHSELVKGEVAKQKGTQMVKTKAMEPMLVIEYKLLESEEIVNVIFDEAEMTVTKARALGMKGLEQRRATETVKVQYPKVLVTKKAVKFLDKEGTVEREILLKKEREETAIVSLTTGKVIITGYAYRKKENNLEEIYRYVNLVDEKGEIKRITECVEFENVWFSGNEKYIAIGSGDMVGESPSGCTLYNLQGNKLWTYLVKSRNWMMHLLYDGKIVIIEHIEEGRRKGKISLIDVDKKKLWEREIEYGQPKIYSTIDGKIIVYIDKYSPKDTYILYGFDVNGDLLWEPKEYEGFDNSFHELVISKNANYLAGLTLWDHLWVMDIRTGKFIWKYPLKGEKPDNVQISSDGKYILLGERYEIGKRLLLCGRTGKVLKEFGPYLSEFLSSKYIWRKKGNKIEVLDISNLIK
jgi:hypothetical protein